MDKIAEHIAKFNAPEGSDFFWVSNISLDKCEEYKREVALSNLVLKITDDEWKYINISGYLSEFYTNWEYILKHEQKGEQMKSIELSEEEIVCIRGILNNHIALYNTSIYSPDIAMCILYQLENAKPIPTEPRFSLDEIIDVLRNEGWESYLINGIIERLKTPKPRLREMDLDERLKWLGGLLVSLDKPSTLVFTDSEERFPNGATITSALYPESIRYRIDVNSPWLPIPQIEIESEK